MAGGEEKDRLPIQDNFRQIAPIRVTMKISSTVASADRAQTVHDLFMHVSVDLARKPRRRPFKEKPRRLAKPAGDLNKVSGRREKTRVM
jgi:hypothetical protein